MPADQDEHTALFRYRVIAEALRELLTPAGVSSCLCRRAGP